MDLGLKGKIAIVSGASRGIGKAIAFGFASEGATLAICSRTKSDIEKTGDEIRRKTGVEVLSAVCDITHSTEIKEFTSKVINQFQKVDILVNNGGGPPPGTFSDLEPKEWGKAVELNLLSYINFSREVIPHMRKQKWGRIINITSTSVKQPIDHLILSNSVRAGVIGFAKSISNELARENILVNNVCPGMTRTERTIELTEAIAKRKEISIEDAMKHREKEIPLGRFAEPKEIASLTVFLASEQASYITGTTIQVDGGFIRSSM
jgi:3-oxoacyl-[acyl-carrier protein] reductase